MANAEIKTHTVEEIILTLSKNEADTLYSVVGNILGHNGLSRRKHINSIWNALDKIKESIGLQEIPGDLENDFKLGTLRFKTLDKDDTRLV